MLQLYWRQPTQPGGYKRTVVENPSKPKSRSPTFFYKTFTKKSNILQRSKIWSSSENKFKNNNKVVFKNNTKKTTVELYENQLKPLHSVVYTLFA